MNNNNNNEEDIVLNGVVNIICDVMEITKDKVKPESNLVTDLNVESLDFVDLVEAFTNEYGVTILDQDIKKINTVEDIAEYIKTHRHV